MPPSAEHGTSIVFSRELTDLASLREWLTGYLGPRPARQGVVDDVVLMASELVTNVIMHTGSAPTITVWDEPDVFVVSVQDDDPALPRLEPVDARRPRGNGLRIVDAWSTTWGTDAVPGAGKMVWFTAKRW
jgi:anti-sigma regulatory factor (Ser/Thr protein kinase)